MEFFSIATLGRIFGGLYELLFVSFFSIIFAILGGVIMGSAMAAASLNRQRAKRIYANNFFMLGKRLGGVAISSIFFGFCFRILLEIVRIIPLIAWLFVLYYGVAAAFNLHISSVLAGIIVFSFWGAAEMGDLVRSSILSVPQIQRESATALGFNALQITLFIVIPQALIHILPSIVNLFGRIIKTTSLLPLIGVVEILKVGQQMIELFSKNDASVSFIIYGSIMIIYFCLCYPLALLANLLEKKLRVYA